MKLSTLKDAFGIFDVEGQTLPLVGWVDDVKPNGFYVDQFSFLLGMNYGEVEYVPAHKLKRHILGSTDDAYFMNEVLGAVQSRWKAENIAAQGGAR